GAGCKFELDPSGTVAAACTTDAFREAMEWYRNAYANGWVNQEFVTMQKQNQEQAIAQDKGGIVVTGLFSGRGYTTLAESIDPETEVEWALINDMTYADVPRRIVSDTGGGMVGLMSFSTPSLFTEDDLHRARSVIDALMEPDCHLLMSNGVEGTHFVKDAARAIAITDQTLWEQQIQPSAGSSPANDYAPLYRSTEERVNLANE